MPERTAKSYASGISSRTARASCTCTGLRSTKARPPVLSRLIGIELMRAPVTPISYPRAATSCSAPSFSRATIVPFDSQRRAAVAAIASSTGCSSLGEREMTLNTSDVAVWYSRLSVSSPVRVSSSCCRVCSSSRSRAFSMAMTAWSANVSTRAIWRSVKGRGDWRPRNSVPTSSESRRKGTPSTTGVASVAPAPKARRLGSDSALLTWMVRPSAATRPITDCGGGGVKFFSTHRRCSSV